MPAGENLVIESVIFRRQFGFLFRQHIQIIRLVQVVFVAPLRLPVVLELFQITFRQAEFLLLTPQVLHHVFEGGERGYELHGRTVVPGIAPVQQVDLRAVPGRLLTVFAELIQGVVETSECQPDFVFDGYGLPAFLKTALHVSDEIHVFQSLHDRAVISRERDVSSCEIVG